MGVYVLLLCVGIGAVVFKALFSLPLPLWRSRVHHQTDIVMAVNQNFLAGIINLLSFWKGCSLGRIVKEHGAII